MIEFIEKKKKGPKPRPIEERFWAKVHKTNTCWIWTGWRQKSGHGNIFVGVGLGKTGAHRISWIINKGPIPEGLFVCHICDIPWCVNPDHLFLGTHDDNMADAWAKGRLKLPDISKMVNRTQCPRGHPFDASNTYRFAGNNGRYCRECRRINQNAYYNRHKTELAEKRKKGRAV